MSHGPCSAPATRIAYGGSSAKSESIGPLLELAATLSQLLQVTQRWAESVVPVFHQRLVEFQHPLDLARHVATRLVRQVVQQAESSAANLPRP